MDNSVTAKFGQLLLLAFPMAAERDIPDDTCQDSDLSGEKNISQNSLRFSKGNQKKDTKSYSVTTYAIVGSVIFGNLAFLSLQSAFGANALEFAFPTGGTEETSDSDEELVLSRKEFEVEDFYSEYVWSTNPDKMCGSEILNWPDEDFTEKNDIQICIKQKDDKELMPQKTLQEMMKTIGFYIKKSFWRDKMKTGIHFSSAESSAESSTEDPEIEKLSSVLRASNDFFDGRKNPAQYDNDDCPELHIEINKSLIYKACFSGGFTKSVYPLFVAIFQSKLACQNPRPQSSDNWKTLIDESAKLVEKVSMEGRNEMRGGSCFYDVEEVVL
eukprot:GHVP01035802.1.p1 GENE.GHVP01035802.1~~GHVP01035802.1.p1  ORF type:complete len:337 (+),score=72.83 GHVP01035802.1:29-1012(+)